MLQDIRSKSFDELSEELKNIGFPSFRAKQIYSWLHEKCVSSFDEMTNVSKSMREELSQIYCFSNCRVDTKLVSKQDETVKYLFGLTDNEFVESVVMKYKYGYSICISTQGRLQNGLLLLCVSNRRLCAPPLCRRNAVGDLYGAKRPRC